MELGLAILKLRTKAGNSKWNEFAGLYISDNEVDAVLEKENDLIPDVIEANGARVSALIDNTRHMIDERKKRSSEKGVVLMVAKLSQCLALNSFETKILIICLAPEIESKYEKLYAYIHNDITKKRPTAGLILDLLCANPEDKIDKRKYFLESATLSKSNVLDLSWIEFDKSDPRTFLLSKPLKLRDHIVNLLLQYDDLLDPSIQGFSTLIRPGGDFQYYDLFADIKERLAKYLEQYTLLVTGIRDRSRSGGFKILYFQGEYGTGKKTVARYLCDHRRIDLILTNVAELITRDSVSFENCMSLLFLEARLRGAAIYLDNLDILFSSDNADMNYRKNVIATHLRKFLGIAFAAGQRSWEYTRNSFSDLYPIIIEFPLTSYSMRRKLWESLLKECLSEEDNDQNEMLDTLANNYALTPRQIQEAVIITRNRISVHGGMDGMLHEKDLHDSCRILSGNALSSFGQKISPRHSWDDIVLPRAKK